MTIRTRLTLWYAGIMLVSLLAMSVLSYLVFVDEFGSSVLRDANVGKEIIAEDQTEDFRTTFRIVFWCGVPPTLLALAGGWWLMRKSLRPVTVLTEAAARINEHNLNKPLARTHNGDEFDRLTEVFNAMIARLDDSFQRIREFTLHASHELKTPLTVIQGELETALADASLAVPQSERLLSQLDEVQRLAKIVDGLTLLTKADAGLVPLTLAPVRLDELVRDCFEDAQILAHAAALRVELASCDELTVTGDSHRLRQLLLNLADNAVKYNQPRGHVTMSLRRVDGAAEFIIANTGQGIPPELLPRVFDRFLRGDAAHTREVEGCGLGLSIAQWIVRAHSGAIEVKSPPSQATVVTVHLPLAAAT